MNNKKLLLLTILLVITTAMLFTGCRSTSDTTTPAETSAFSITTVATEAQTTAATEAQTTAATEAQTTAETTVEAPITTVVTTPEEFTVNLMTYNLRYDISSHPLMSTEVRGAHLIEEIKEYEPDSISFQEATDNWMNYLRVELAKLNYSYVGLGRDNGIDKETLKTNGNEHCPVFYRNDKYELVDSGNFWLSTTPDIRGSISWSSACKRICSYVVLKDKTTGSMYAHFGTHLDHVSENAKNNGVMVIQTYINRVLEKYGDIGIALSGDFNSVAFDSTDPDYEPVTYNLVTAFLDDSYKISTNVLKYGSTFPGYQNPAEWEKGNHSSSDKPDVDLSSSPIDFIFVRKGTSVGTYTIVDKLFTFEYDGKTWHDHPVSDHFGVFCTATFKKTGFGTIIPDESKNVKHIAEIVTDTALPDKLSAYTSVIGNAKLSSGLLMNASYPLANLLVSDKYSKVKTSASSKQHVFWEIGAELAEETETYGFSFTTADNEEALPSSISLYVLSEDGNWEKTGNTVFEKQSTSTTVYYIFEKPITTKKFKLVIADAPYNVELAAINVYGTITQ